MFSSPVKETRAKSTNPIQIPEIPPFRKNINQHQQQTNLSSSQNPIAQSHAIINPSAPKIHELQHPHYKPRKSTEWTPPTEHHPEHHHLTITPLAGAEWAKRLKGESLNLHRSTDCITKELAVSSDSELLKAAPSWTDVALRQEPNTSNSAPSVKTPSDEESKGNYFQL